MEPLCDRSAHTAPEALVTSQGLLGEGGFGVVVGCVKARQPPALAAEHATLFERLPAKYAVKVPTRGGHDENEFKAQATVARENPDLFPSLYGCVTLASGVTLVFMEAVRGMDLFDFLTKRTRSMARRVLQPLVHGLLRALTALHAAGVVHRDLKPENIMVSEAAGVLQIRILDFGLSCGLAGAPCEGLRGTPGYIHPVAAGLFNVMKEADKPVPPRVFMLNDFFAAAVTVTLACERAFNYVNVQSRRPSALPLETLWEVAQVMMENPTEGPIKRKYHNVFKRMQNQMCTVLGMSQQYMRAAGRRLDGIEAFVTVVQHDASETFVDFTDGAPMFSSEFNVEDPALEDAIMRMVEPSRAEMSACVPAGIRLLPVID